MSSWNRAVNLSNVLRHLQIKSNNYKNQVDAGAKTVMINSGLINGIPVHADYNLLINVLRNKLDFQGVILTDWEDIRKLHDRDKVAKSQKEAVKIAINAGIDMVMVSGQSQPYKKFIRLLKENVEEGLIPMSRIDDAVTRILKVKIRNGLNEKKS